MKLFTIALSLFVIGGSEVVAGDVRLTSPRLEILISEKTGDIEEVRDKATLVCHHVESRYKVVSRNGEHVVSGNQDVVKTIERPDVDTLAVEVGNPQLTGVSILKKYRFEEGGTRMVMETTVSFNESEDAFLALSSHVGLTDEFRKGGFYSDPSRHPSGDTRLAADKITKSTVPRIEGIADWHRVIFTTKAFEHSLLHERSRINGRPVTPITNHGYGKTLEYDATGWTLGLEAFRIAKGKKESVEWTFQLVDGDQSLAWAKAKELPGYRELHAHTPPAWVKEVKYFHAHSFGADDEEFRWVKKMLENTEDGYILVMISELWGADDIGLYPTEGEWMGTQKRASKEEVRALVDKLHAMSPRVKVSVYTWWWGFSNTGKFAQLHPDWLIRDAKGKNVYTQIGPNLDRTYAVNLVPGLREHILDRVAAMMKDFDLDVLYLDGGQGGVTDFDWASVSKSSDAEWMDLYRDMLATIRNAGPDKAFWTNGTTGLYSAYTDCGYFEGFNEPENWRGLSERLMQVKAFQDPGKWTTLLYLHPTNAERYLSYMFLLGLQPPAYSSGHYSARKMVTQQAPIDLLDELKGSRLLAGSGFSPKWWRGAAEEEIYLHDLRQNLLITGMTHAKGATSPVKVTVPLEDIPEHGKKDLFVWSWELADLKFCDEIRNAKGVQAKDIYSRYGLAPDQLVATRFWEVVGQGKGAVELELPVRHLNPGALYVSSSPGVVVAEDGRPLQTWQASTEKTEVTGSLDRDRISASVTAKGNAEVLFVFPAKNVQVFQAGKAVPFTYRAGVAPAGWSAVVLPLDNGKHEIQMTSADAHALGGTPVNMTLREENAALSIFPEKGGPGPVAFTLTRDGIPVAWGQGTPSGNGSDALLSIPIALLEPGKYSAKVKSAGFAEESANELSVASTSPKILSAMVNRVDSTVTEHQGIKVLSSWEQTVGHSDFNFAVVDRANLRLDVGLGERLYGYGHAGLELQKVQSLLLKVKLTPPSAGVAYHFRHNAFLGLTLDFHTDAGWKRRAWIALGTQAQRTNANALPQWGTHSSEAAPGMDSKYADLTSDLSAGGERHLWVDLQSYAPAGWDGRVIVGAVDRVAARGTRLECQIIESDVPYPGGDCLMLKQDVDIAEDLKNHGWEIVHTPGTAKQLDIEASVYGKGLAHATMTPKIGKIVVSGPEQAGGYLTTNARLPTIKITKNSRMSGAWVAVDFYITGEGFSKRILFPLGAPGPECPLPAHAANHHSTTVAEPIAPGEWAQLDLIKHAPEKWGGTAILWLVSGKSDQEGRLAIEVMENIDSYRY